MLQGRTMSNRARLGFGGQSLVVELLTEDRLYGRHASPVPDADRAGGPELNRILDRALDDGFTYLRYLDPFQDTIFNSVQMPAIIPELERLGGSAQTSAEQKAIDKVLALARRCAGSVHCFLRFVSD